MVPSTSIAAGTSAECISACVIACARAASGAVAVTYARARGSGCSRNAASTIRPSVPSEPVNSLPRS